MADDWQTIELRLKDRPRGRRKEPDRSGGAMWWRQRRHIAASVSKLIDLALSFSAFAADPDGMVFADVRTGFYVFT